MLQSSASRDLKETYARFNIPVSLRSTHSKARDKFYSQEIRNATWRVRGDSDYLRRLIVLVPYSLLFNWVADRVSQRSIIADASSDFCFSPPPPPVSLHQTRLVARKEMSTCSTCNFVITARGYLPYICKGVAKILREKVYSAIKFDCTPWNASMMDGSV